MRNIPPVARSLLVTVILLAVFLSLSSFPGAQPSLPDSAPEPETTPEPTPRPSPTLLPTPTPSPTPVPFVLPEVCPYEEGVAAGAIRYVSQLKEVASNGWGKYAWKAGNECTTACISMALSYLGVDASPEDLLSYSSKTILSSAYGKEEELEPSSLTAVAIEKEDRLPVFSEMFSRYTAGGDIAVTPVLIYLQGKGHNHAILIIGNDGDEYLALDPAPEGIHRITITEDGAIATEEPQYLARYLSADSPAYIHSLAQWQLPGTFPDPEPDASADTSADSEQEPMPEETSSAES